MNNKRMITEIKDKEIGSLLTYSIPYTEKNAANIKKLVQEKINPKKRLRYRQIRIATFLILMFSIGIIAYYIDAVFFRPGME